MEEDDEFGDLYTDVLQTFPSQSATSQPYHPSSSPASLHPTVDLNFQTGGENALYRAPHLISTISGDNKTLVGAVESYIDTGQIRPADTNGDKPGVEEVENSCAGEEKMDLSSPEKDGSKVLESEDVNLPAAAVKDSDVGKKSASSSEKDGSQKACSMNFDDEHHKDIKFDVEDGGEGSEQIIPGLSTISSTIQAFSTSSEPVKRDYVDEDDWDSDSEDDLQIVLNDNSHRPMAIDRVGSDDGDEDGDPLVIVADGDDPSHQAMEEQDWGEDGPQVADGERKEGEAPKTNGAVVTPKIGYSSHGYHPFHSQFKYVRPGASPIPGGATVGLGAVPGQVRPLFSAGAMAGRGGRGDWRAAGLKNTSFQKGFHSGFSGSAWGNNALGRSYGGGLEFTLPSHKTVFDVDVDSFEEKPWRYPGVDISDFFNFSLNEESWKEYCKQLEQLRLESTMQSKIRVYESGRTEREYDPDMPPELAAAAGIADVSAENPTVRKIDGGQSDIVKASGHARPPLPTGRAIQVEGGYGERLPSIDTRPPRIRDSDAIIEIFPHGPANDDDSFTENDRLEQSDHDLRVEDLKGGQLAEDILPEDTGYFGDYPQTYNERKKDTVGRRSPLVSSVCNDIPESKGVLAVSPEASIQRFPASGGQSPVCSSGNLNHYHEDRLSEERFSDRSPHITSQSTKDITVHDTQKDESVDSMDGKGGEQLISHIRDDTTEQPTFEEKVPLDDDILPDGNSELERQEAYISDADKERSIPHYEKKQKISSRVEQPAIQEPDDAGDTQPARSSDNSKARSGSSRDYQKRRDGADEEVVQDRSQIRNTKRHLDEDQSLLRRDQNRRQELERNRMVVKGREGSYPYRDWGPTPVHHSHSKMESSDRRKERDRSEGAWQRRDENSHGQRIRTDDTRKRERDVMGSKHWGKVRDAERSEKVDYLHSRKQMDNGTWRSHHDNVGSRHRERDDDLKSRVENANTPLSKRRKEEEYHRRGYGDKEENLHVHKESASRRKRERDDALDQRRKDDLRTREHIDDLHSIRQREEVWLQDRSERHRERDEHHRLKKPHEESQLKRGKEESRGVSRSGRGPDEKAWVGHARGKDEYKIKDKETARHGEPLKRRDRRDDESFSSNRGFEDSYARGNHFSSDERRSRQERPSSRNERVSASDNQRAHERKHKENARKNRESDGTDHNSLGLLKRHPEGYNNHVNETAGLKVPGEQGNGEHELPMPRHSSRKHREEASSDDEQQGTRRGRSKLERWASQKDRNYTTGDKSSVKIKEVESNDNGGSSLPGKLPDDLAKPVGPAENHHSIDEEKDTGQLESKDPDSGPHLDTVAKLKKRSERFKLPMPTEKELAAIKKMESEALPLTQSETPPEAEIKLERPARKRRWVGS